MGDHDYGTHDTSLCMECLGYTIGYRTALREAADEIERLPGEYTSGAALWLRARAEGMES